MNPAQPQPEILKLVANWSDLYCRNFYNLAMFEVSTALDYRPNNPLLWFFKGLTQLAQRDAKGARASFDKAREFSSTAIEEPELKGIAAKLQQGLLIAENALACNALPVPPKNPLDWLEGPMPQVVAAKAQTSPKPAEIKPAIAAVASVLSGAVASASAAGERFVFSPANTTTRANTTPPPPPPKPTLEDSPSITNTGGQLQISTPTKPSWDQWETQLRKHFDAGDFDMALKQVNLAIERHANDHWLVEWRARILEKQGNLVRASEEMLNAVRLAHEQNHADKAATLARSAIVLSHSNNDAMLKVGTALAAMGLAPAAAEALRQAEAIARRTNDHPRLISALKHLSRLHPQNSAYGHELAILTDKLQAATASLPPQGTLSKKQRKELAARAKPAYSTTIGGKTNAKEVSTPGGMQVSLSLVAGMIAFLCGLAGNAGAPFIILIVHNIISAALSKGGQVDNIGQSVRKLATFIIIIAIILGIIRH
ncbi:hypothetical protein IT570_11850 [Candidatus Sumerlaeota bacterium]|nr:hypothetical protein [Candidatus Sumerlaeota bacterium]